MPPIEISITPDVKVGDGHPLLVMAGPCVIEDEALCLHVAKTMKAICTRLGLSYVFKASYDKANRTSVDSFRGPGIEAGLRVLASIKEAVGVPVITDVHEPRQAELAAEVVDVLQIPAFLCRQTDLLVAAGRTGKTISVKKGQFIAPDDMRRVIDKVLSTGNENILLTERGTTFGYHNLVVDMRSLAIMRSYGFPVVFDATHAVQLPGGQGDSSGGDRQFVPPLLRAAMGVGIDGVFLETHPNPDEALCDGPNSMPLGEMEQLLTTGKTIHEFVRKHT